MRVSVTNPSSNSWLWRVPSTTCQSVIPAFPCGGVGTTFFSPYSSDLSPPVTVKRVCSNTPLARLVWMNWLVASGAYKDTHLYVPHDTLFLGSPNTPSFRCKSASGFRSFKRILSCTFCQPLKAYSLSCLALGRRYLIVASTTLRVNSPRRFCGASALGPQGIAGVASP